MLDVKNLKASFSFLFFLVFAACVTLTGLVIALLGALLIQRGGSPFYAVSGTLLTAAGVQLFRRRESSLHLVALNFFVTWFWALAEAGLDGWALLPRVNLISGVLLLYALPPIRSRLQPGAMSSHLAPMNSVYPVAAPLLVAAIVSTVAASAWWDRFELSPMPVQPRTALPLANTDWRSFGNDPGGAKFSPLSGINVGNVGRLTRVWDYAEPAVTRSATDPSRKDEATPLQVDGKLFVCLADNTILALDAEDGRLLWRHDPHSDLTSVNYAVCRGVAYFEDAGSPTCPKRVITGTLDARLIAIDAQTGKPCQDFGQNGQISLKEGLGPFEKGMYYQTSPPAVTRGLAIVGALVPDNVSVGEPSGVIRAFDARNGKLVWAWDAGRPGANKGELKPGEIYTPGTPNSWSLFSVDEELGLVYLPVGNATPNHSGSHRNPEWEKYVSSVVALDVETGQVRWSYQVVRHDLWDYDVSAQPVLFDMPVPGGGVIPALLQATKQGDLFVLDRRTGEPVTPVEERPVPQTSVPGEWTSQTQPFSVGMPNVAGPRLRESDMWGISPVDQLLCRMEFKRLRYDGIYTPPSLGGSLAYPGLAGGVNWGSVSIDKTRNLLFVPSFHMACTIELVSHEAAAKGARYSELQKGTPYFLNVAFFRSRLRVPCQRPPYGVMTAIDLRTRTVVWRKPLGTAEDLGPLGIPSRLPLTIGAAPVVGGPTSTAGDLVFIGAVGDRRLRALNSLTGRELWSDKLPSGSQATPITYQAPRSGRQMVVIVSGGFAILGDRSDQPVHVVAYALP